MKSKNLIGFYLVGKSTTERSFLFLTLMPTKKGWTQTCTEDRSYNCQYVCNENVTDLMKWFRIDFTQYRIFDDLQDAKSYLQSKIEAREVGAI